MARPAPICTTRRNDVAGDTESLKAAARATLWNCGMAYGSNRIARLVRDFQSRVEGSGFAFVDTELVEGGDGGWLAS